MPDFKLFSTIIAGFRNRAREVADLDTPDQNRFFDMESSNIHCDHCPFTAFLDIIFFMFFGQTHLFPNNLNRTIYPFSIITDNDSCPGQSGYTPTLELLIK